MSIGTIVLSDFVNPDFGQSFPVEMEIEWRTDVVTLGIREQVNECWDRPKRYWFINWPALSAPARLKLLEAFNRGRGRANTFLWRDYDDNKCEVEAITTNGTAATYQLCKTYYPGETEQWTEDKTAIMPFGVYAPVVTHDIDGAQAEVPAAPGANQYTLDDATGIMTWSGGNEPSAGVLTVTFGFYYRVRWTDDKLRDSQFAPGWWHKRTGPHLIEVVS